MDDSDDGMPKWSEQIKGYLEEKKLRRYNVWETGQWLISSEK